MSEQRIDVKSRQQVAPTPTEGDPNVAVISISQPGEKLGWYDGWAGVLQLEFWDLMNPSLAYPDAVLFDEVMAEQIQNFVEEHQEKSFLIHCDAGVSRSVAVGLWISETYEIPLYTHATHTTAAANGRVLRLLRRSQWLDALNRNGN